MDVSGAMKNITIKRKRRPFKGYIAVDFDAVLATYNRPFIFDKLGEPNQDLIDVVNEYYDKGYYIYIFTGRIETPTILQWLKDNRVKYHSYNTVPDVNPYNSKAKPFYDVIIDDKSVNYHFRNNVKTKSELRKEINKILNKYLND